MLQPTLPGALRAKWEKLQSQLAQTIQSGGLIVAFSGGVDSAFLLWAAKQAQTKLGVTRGLLAVTAVSASMAEAERQDARSFAQRTGVEHLWIESHEVENPLYAQNDGNRCYHCKSELFRIGWDVAREHGMRWLAYGYNASDRGDIRPGHRAAAENDVLSPLAEAELTKDEIRQLMRAFDLPLSEKPASPCLSSRLMTGVLVTPEKLKIVEDLETHLRTHGLKIFRVRLHEDEKARWVRLELSPDEMARALELRESFLLRARNYGVQWVTLDLAGYKMGGGVA